VTYLRVLGAWCLVLGAAAAAFAQAPAPQQRPAQLPTLPLTQLDERGLSTDLDTRAFTLTFAQPVPIRDLLLLLVRGTSLSIVPDPGVEGTFIGELKNVSVRQALDLILRPLGLDYNADATVVHVFKRQPETRIFDLNYAASERVGTTTIGVEAGRTATSVGSTSKADVFDDLAAGVRTLLTEHATFNVDRKAGLLQVTDFPERLERVAIYLDAVSDRLHRQVQIEARVIELEPNDENKAGLDWTALATELNGAQTAAQRAAPRPSLTGLRVTDLPKLMELLATRGKIETLTNTRLLTLNNEPSIVRTDSVAFTVAPQIASEGVVTLSLSEIVTAPTVAEADMLARVADGETLVIAGFTRERDVEERKVTGARGTGWFGRGTVTTRKRMELIILLTPRIVAGVVAQ
jgi:MSHA biogenesis protein MshL